MKFYAVAALVGATLADQLFLATDEPSKPIVFGCKSDIQLVEEGEGLRTCEYKDTVGIPTICYGYNLSRGQAKSDITAVGGDYNSVMAGGCLTKSQCESLLDKDMGSARKGEKDIFGNSIKCKCAQSVLVDMTYNLGEAGLASFNTFDTLMKEGKWTEAVNDLKTTKW
eukprot:CAMPEP_0170490834 /NCGR_PEP_ID=MMETSP0208-20121228/9866_1 /TAXON_ID=197538 /ORGANISM="Strombidium inclinatum, Strain S3" /LENGTH=167 /DNA_ID=CAMNT_0010766295 /DNA_START=12 /DNA_END=512 /DNA_ORIENTATION=+